MIVGSCIGTSIFDMLLYYIAPVKLKFTCCSQSQSKGQNMNFSVAAPTLRGTLPDNIKSEETVITFRRNVKTYL